MLEETIENIKNNTDTITFIDGSNNNVEDYFKSELNCSFVPKQVIEFYEKYDGIDFDINELYSLKQIKEETNELKEYSDSYEIDYDNNKYIPIANDGMGGYYAFLSDREDEKIYWIDTENVGNEWKQYKDLSEFLNEVLEFVLNTEE